MDIFDVKGWIVGNCSDAHTLTPETLQVVSNFTLMWNLFENTVCDNDAKIAVFERIAGAIAQYGSDSIHDGIRF